MSSNLPTTNMPMSIAHFETDPRIHYNTVSQKWEFEDDDGNEMEWDDVKNAWVPLVDEELVRQQQAVYSVAGVDENTPAAPVLARENKKRKAGQSNGDITTSAGPAKKKGKNEGSTNTKPASKNTAVFVSNLPRDATVDEIAERFGKFGVIMEDDAGEPKIKMYADDKGNFNGEALVVYFMEGSVNLAVNLLDEAELRLGDQSTIMRVQPGEFGHKQSGGVEVTRRVVDKKKATSRIAKLKNKVGDWDFDDGFGPTEEPVQKEQIIESRVVVLKHMFTLEELKEDPSLLLDLKEDVREEAETIGDVTNVVLYDEEPEGIMTIKFRDPISAKACIIKMNGRWFSGRQIEASFFTGRQRFRKSGHSDEAGDDANEKERLAGFEKWLMAEGETA
ncbi:related to Splicing factor U2AF-associated protein 2 [Serendipita indica DSM 11827]|uniref:Related to Splicing factor U2AF-associated protein 2 n=1 Tax=Serendipita indica (strain DSM 11827) TaxID=1109443 RepID=G4T8E4_SERID|nr:related to Splicing factor U2AF-associated protein 2 [Serendipita indica DSM 11827]